MDVTHLEVDVAHVPVLGELLQEEAHRDDAALGQRPLDGKPQARRHDPYLLELGLVDEAQPFDDQRLQLFIGREHGSVPRRQTPPAVRVSSTRCTSAWRDRSVLMNTPPRRRPSPAARRDPVRDCSG